MDEAERREAEAEQYAETQRYLVRVPVARYYALLVGLALTPLGILGFVPALTQGGVFLGIMRVTPVVNVIHLVTGLAGLAVYGLRQGRYARYFPLAIAVIYLLTFTTGNIAFGNFEGAPTARGPDIPWILENALHAGLMLTGALIGGLAALQRGDQATTREFEERRGKFDPKQPPSSPPASA